MYFLLMKKIFCPQQIIIHLVRNISIKLNFSHDQSAQMLKMTKTNTIPIGNHITTKADRNNWKLVSAN